MLFSPIYKPGKQILKNKPETVTEKKYSKYLRSTYFKNSNRLNLRNSKIMIKSHYGIDIKYLLKRLNIKIEYPNNCSSEHKKSIIMQFVEVPEDKKIIAEAKNILLKAKPGKDLYNSNVKRALKIILLMALKQ